MSRFLDNDSVPHATLPKMMKAWAALANRTATNANIVTVMFTDMVGSTNITQDRGDDRAQVAGANP